MNMMMDEGRKQRGLQLSQSRRLKQVVAGTWLVPSQSENGGYLVKVDEGSCTCPDHELRGQVITCKHRWAVHFARFREENHLLDQEIKRPTYGQNWKAYNAAQRNEKELILRLLRSLCDQVPHQKSKGRGRPKTPLADVVFAAGTKVFVGFSGRRADTDVRDCAAKGLLTKHVAYNTVFERLNDPDLIPTLKELVKRSALPLTRLETKFAIDATGFGTKVYRRWFDEKYGEERKEATWVKLHAVCGINTGVITSLEVTDGYTNDSPLLPQLVSETARNFKVDQILADKGYLSIANFEAIDSIGAVPFIKYKRNSQLNDSPLWNRSYHLFSLNQEEWLPQYSQRSNIEAVFSSVKRVLGGAVRSRSDAAQFNEVLIKCIVHNLRRLVHAMFEFGIDPDFRGAVK